ncbi:MAG: MdtA/MuxA family multidrug efflux RND transporter periplasmic adaptor subunit [Pseudomonadota bacterium]
MKNGKIVPGILFLVVLVSGASWWYLNHTKAIAASSTESKDGTASGKKHGGSGDNKPVAVLVASVEKGDIRVVQTAVGTVTPSAVVSVSSRINGQLTRILFKEGQLVRAGELLAEIDPRPFQAALTQVQGQALRDQALLRNSQIDLERYKTLQAQDSIASQQVDAQASLVQQYQGTVLADQGLVDNAKLQLSFTHIISPINGRIGLRQVDLGNNITTTNTLAVVNTVDPIHVVFTLPEDRVSNLVKRFQETHKSGKGLPVEAWDRSNTTLLAKGSLLSLDNQIDTTSGTVKLKAQFVNKDSPLFPNQFVNVRLLSDTLHDVAIVPNAAIQHGSAGAFVYLITPDKDATKVIVQTVKLGTVDGDNVAVLDGLKPKDQVVISGIDKLRDNAKVKISSPDGKAGKEGRQGGKRGKGDSSRHQANSSNSQTPTSAAQ